jgi:hypothetical protein
MRKIAFGAFLLLCAINFTACKDNDDIHINYSAVEGTWRIASIGDSVPDAMYDYTFLADKTWKLRIQKLSSDTTIIGDIYYASTENDIALLTLVRNKENDPKIYLDPYSAQYLVLQIDKKRMTLRDTRDSKKVVLENLKYIN